MTYSEMNYPERIEYINGLFTPGRIIRIAQPFLAGNPEAECTIISATKKEVTFAYKGETYTKNRKHYAGNLAQAKTLTAVN